MDKGQLNTCSDLVPAKLPMVCTELPQHLKGLFTQSPLDRLIECMTPDELAEIRRQIALGGTPKIEYINHGYRLTISHNDM